MIIVTTNKVEGREIKNVLGLVQASSVRARAIGRDITALFKLMAGGEITEYDLFGNFGLRQPGRSPIFYLFGNFYIRLLSPLIDNTYHNHRYIYYILDICFSFIYFWKLWFDHGSVSSSCWTPGATVCSFFIWEF